MFRVTKMGGNVFAAEFEEVEEEAEHIQNLANEGTPVLVVDELESALWFFGLINIDEIEVV